MSGDARQIAAAILARLGIPETDTHYCAYGSQYALTLGLGKRSSLLIENFETLDRVWEQIDGFIRRHAGEYVMGFIGFDPGNQIGRRIDAPQCKLDLFIPETVIQCNSERAHLASGCLPFELDTLVAADIEVATGALDIAGFDSERQRASYVQAVSGVLERIKQGRLKRVTLARKLSSRQPLDLVRTFLSDRSSHELSRSFLFSNSIISFAGQSPELLAHGDCHCFMTHKLSGTMARAAGSDVEALQEVFISDLRITAEHQSAIATIEHSLTELGEVKSEKFMVMELPTLLHGWSRFTTKPVSGSGIADCLRSIFPYGLNPVEAGFELLRSYEDFARGPYYGLVGCIMPSGRFTFSQVLRSAFTDLDGSYVIAGAAITGLSTPQLEFQETTTKLSGIRVYPMASIKRGSPRI
jgi:isochorismate synthase EntC